MLPFAQRLKPRFLRFAPRTTTQPLRNNENTFYNDYNQITTSPPTSVLFITFIRHHHGPSSQHPPTDLLTSPKLKKSKLEEDVTQLLIENPTTPYLRITIHGKSECRLKRLLLSVFAGKHAKSKTEPVIHVIQKRGGWVMKTAPDMTVLVIHTVYANDIARWLDFHSSPKVPSNGWVKVIRCEIQEKLIDEDVEKRLTLLPDRLNKDLRRLSTGGTFVIIPTYPSQHIDLYEEASSKQQQQQQQQKKKKRRRVLSDDEEEEAEEDDEVSEDDRGDNIVTIFQWLGLIRGRLEDIRQERPKVSQQRHSSMATAREVVGRKRPKNPRTGRAKQENSRTGRTKQENPRTTCKNTIKSLKNMFVDQGGLLSWSDRREREKWLMIHSDLIDGPKRYRKKRDRKRRMRLCVPCRFYKA